MEGRIKDKEEKRPSKEKLDMSTWSPETGHRRNGQWAPYKQVRRIEL